MNTCGTLIPVAIRKTLVPGDLVLAGVEVVPKLGIVAREVARAVVQFHVLGAIAARVFVVRAIVDRVAVAHAVVDRVVVDRAVVVLFAVAPTPFEHVIVVLFAVARVVAALSVVAPVDVVLFAAARLADGLLAGRISQEENSSH